VEAGVDNDNVAADRVFMRQRKVRFADLGELFLARLSVITLALVILAFIFLSLRAALIARYPFAVAARSPL